MAAEGRPDLPDVAGLTLAELMDRVADEKSTIAWRVHSALMEDGRFWDVDMEFLRDHANRLNTYMEAAETRADLRPPTGYNAPVVGGGR